MTNSTKNQLTPNELEKVFSTIQAKIKKHGFTCLYTENADESSFGYTVGLSDFGLPDIILRRVKFDETLLILNTAAHYFISQKSTTIPCFQLVSGIFNVDVKFKEMDNKDVHPCYIKTHYHEASGHESGMVELFIPNPNGKFEDKSTH
jgi:hypothetical protein